jgi:aspartyl/asparaginyl-tRNA synthetase
MVPAETAFLAQSPQLAKQMCIAGDMERVYEIAPGAFALP